MQIKLWNKYIVAPSNMIIKKTFNEWKEYIDNNSKKYQIKTRSMKENENDKDYLNLNQFDYIQRSPLSRTYKLIEKLHKFKNNNDSNNKYYKFYGKIINNEKIFKEREIQARVA